MVEPGVYRIQFGRLSLAECWRMSKPATFPIALLFKLIHKQGAHLWLPDSDGYARCDFGALTDEAQRRLSPYIQEMASLGYRRGAFHWFAKAVDPTINYVAACVALHDDGMRIMTATYMHLVAYKPAGTMTVKKVNLSGVLLLEDLGRVLVLAYRAYFDPAPQTRIVTPQSPGAAGVDLGLQQEMQASGGSLLRFGDLEGMLSAWDRANDEGTAAMIARGMYRRVSTAEERRVMARRGLTR